MLTWLIWCESWKFVSMWRLFVLERDGECDLRVFFSKKKYLHTSKLTPAEREREQNQSRDEVHGRRANCTSQCLINKIQNCLLWCRWYSGLVLITLQNFIINRAFFFLCLYYSRSLSLLIHHFIWLAFAWLHWDKVFMLATRNRRLYRRLYRRRSIVSIHECNSLVFVWTNQIDFASLYSNFVLSYRFLMCASKWLIIEIEMVGFELKQLWHDDDYLKSYNIFFFSSTKHFWSTLHLHLTLVAWTRIRFDMFASRSGKKAQIF